MKILQVIPYYLPAEGYGGPVRVCSTLSSFFISKKHTVTVITTDASDINKPITKKYEKMHGINVIRFKNIFPNLTKKWNIFLPLGIQRWIRNNVYKYDIVHIHSFFALYNIIVVYFCIKYSIPYIIHLHESPIPIKNRGKYFIKVVFNWICGKYILKYAAAIITLTENDRQEIISYMPSVFSLISVIHNGIALTKLQSNRSKAELRQTYGIKKNDIVILSLSRLSYLKGVDLLLHAFLKLLKMQKNAFLIIAGPDEGLFNTLQNTVKKYHLHQKIIFTGLVTGEQKEDLYEMSDIYALFSRYEPFSLTTLEALKHNLPVCLSREVGINSSLQPYNCSMTLTNSNDPDKSAKELLWTIQKRKTLSKETKNALRMFDLKNQCRAIEKLYTKVIK